MSDDDAMTRLHEAGHAVVAVALGHRSLGITVRGGSSLAGCARYSRLVLPEAVTAGAQAAVMAGRPYIAFPGDMRAAIENRVVIAMAGDVAMLALSPPGVSTRTPPPIAEQAQEIAATAATPARPVTLPKPSPELVALFDREVNAVEPPSDAMVIAETARHAHGDDVAAMGCWLRYLETATRALVLAEAALILRLADVLALEQTLSGEAVAAVLAG